MARPLTSTEIIAAFTKWGVKFYETSGWKTRDNGSHWTDKKSVTGVMYHHTASDASDAVNRALITNGRTGLSGPLANFGVRDDGTIDIIAVGSANHAGKGDPDTLKLVQTEKTPMTSEVKPDQSSASATSVGGNSRFYGWESYYGIGSDPTANAIQHRATVLSMAAIIDKLDEIDTANSWSGASAIGHREWTRAKIDPSGIKMYEVRTLINTIRKAGPAAAKVWLATGSFTVNPPPSGGTVAVPVYKGNAQSQDVWKAFMSSDFIPAPGAEAGNTNPYWSGSSYLNYLGDWSRETVIATRELKTRVTALETKLDEVLALLKAQ